MFRIIITALLVLASSTAYAGHRCFLRTCKKSYCKTCYPVVHKKPIIQRQKVIIEETAEVETKTNVRNNLKMPPVLAPIVFEQPIREEKPLRRSFQFAENVPEYVPRPQQQLQQRQMKINQGNAFIIQNVVTSGSSVEATVVNQGYQKSVASSKTTVETSEEVVEESTESKVINPCETGTCPPKYETKIHKRTGY